MNLYLLLVPRRRTGEKDAAGSEPENQNLPLQTGSQHIQHPRKSDFDVSFTSWSATPPCQVMIPVLITPRKSPLLI